MIRQVLLLLFLFPLAPARGQITIPDEVEPHTPLVAGCDCTTPEGSEIRIRWTLSDGAEMIPVDNTVHVWAPPGSHKITASVVWMQFEEVEVPMGKGVNPKKIRNLVAWDLQTFSKIFTVKGGSPGPGPGPGPDPDPDPDPPNGFEAKILTALESIGNPPSRKTLAKIYSEVAEKANTRRDVYKPATMVDEAKTRVASELSPSDLRTWTAFWPQMNEAFKERKMEETDTDAFIDAFRDLAKILGTANWVRRLPSS